MQYDFEHQVLIGTILGGSSLARPPKGRNFYISMRSKNARWLKYKMAEMPSFFKDQKVRLYNGTYRANSSCLPRLTEIWEELYRGNERNISMPILDSLRDIGIAVWFIDGGSKAGRGKKNAYINTTKFREEGTRTILQYFNEVGMSCNINRGKSSSNMEQ